MLDCAAMLVRREEDRQKGIHRQLMFDSSPRKGVGLFAVRELVTVRGDVANTINRKLPITSLGVGRFSAEDKAIALLWVL